MDKTAILRATNNGQPFLGIELKYHSGSKTADEKEGE